MQPWSSEEAVALRSFLKKVPAHRLSEIMQSLCPATITAELILENNAEAITRIAAMKSGWEEYEKTFIKLSEFQKPSTMDSDYKSMSD